MKHKTFKMTSAPLPENERTVGGDYCKKTAADRKKSIKSRHGKLIKLFHN